MPDQEFLEKKLQSADAEERREAVIDLSRGTPRVAYLRDITRLGLPFALDTDLLERKR